MNLKLRQKKIAQNKKKRKEHKKSYDTNQKCKFGAYRSKEQGKSYNEQYDKLKKHFAI